MAFELIPAEVRSRLKGLRLLSRKALGDKGFGLHHSRSRGAGLEFAQYRAYEPGDELRQIDWKLYGRSGKFFVREAERESPLALWILIDCSASMHQGDAANPGYTRLDAAKSIAACLGELAMQQGDRFGCIGLHASRPNLLPPSDGVRQRDRLWLQLGTLQASGEFPDDDKLALVRERTGAGDMIIVLSDGFDETCIELMEKLSAAKREVLFVQILTAEERDFPFGDGRLFVEPETNEELRGDGEALRKEFLQKFRAAQAALKSRLRHAGVGMATHCLDEPIDSPLRKLFGDVDAAEYS